ncbi:MAG: radical SAM protein [Deltaproteobacteria bacterium]|nr:radical SAM protein [Deltaproteobacteria bacterium]
MKKGKYRYLFGPVPSRRFGRSLGVDLTPFKTCDFDCIFCQLGKTSQKTVERKDYVPIKEVIAEIENWLETDGNADYITLSGSGEPTLHTGFGKVLEFLKESSIPSVLLTNGSMLSLPEVRHAASYADIVKVSLSAWNQDSFEWVNRPHHQLHFDRIVKGQKKFREQFNGELWMEVFLLAGMNSMPDDVKKIAALIKEINPDRIQLNTAVRPPAETFAAVLPKNRLEKLTGLFDPPAEIIAEFSTDQTENIQVNEDAILSMLQRRPCTIDQIAEVFGMHINEVSKYIGKLLRSNHICKKKKKSAIYYTAVLEKDNM